MLQALFSSKTRIEILRLFLIDSNKKYFSREISTLLNEPLTPTRRELANLKKVGLLRVKKKGPIKYYFLNPDFLLCKELRSILHKAYGLENTKKALKRIAPKKDMLHDENAA
jgi:hypothetical protein